MLGTPYLMPSFFYPIFFAFVPLFLLEEKTKTHPNSYLLFNYSFLSFLIWNSLAYWWVSKAHLTGVFFIILLNSMVQATIFWLCSYSRKQLKIKLLLPLLIIWLGFEYFHTIWDLAWPWLNLGQSLAAAPKWIQWYEFTGTRGGSLWILLINYLFFKIFLNQKNFRYGTIILLLLIYLLPLLSSQIQWESKEENQEQRTYLAYQPNLDPYTEKFNPKNEQIHFQDFLHTIDSVFQNKHFDYVVGPETLVLESIDENKPKSSGYFNSLQTFQQKYPDTKLLIGVHSHRTVQKKKENYNSAMLLTKDTVLFYHKNKLVPLFERIPFHKYLSFLEDYSLEIGGYNGTYSSENHTNSFSVNDSISILPIVCFESIFGDYNARRLQKNKGFACMLTNDGWWKNTLGYYYHFNFSRIRAIEIRRHYLRVANNGISAQINSKGKVITSTKWWTKTVMEGKIPLLKGKTFYAEHGDYIGRIGLFFAILLLIFVKISSHTQRNILR